MQTGQQFKRIPIGQAADLPRLKAPAGYVVVIQDVEYGNRFKIAQLAQIDRDQIRRVAELSIEIRLALILEAENAAGLALALHDRFVGRGKLGDWFDLDDAQLAQLDDLGRPQLTSLRELAFNEMRATSLVGDATIVRTAPQSPFDHLRRREKRPARRWTAWVVLLLIVVLLATIVTRRTEISREISSLLDLRQNQAAPTGRAREPGIRVTVTPTFIPGQGGVFYVRERGRARSCASTSCPTVEFLDAGSRIAALRFEEGQSVGGDNVWIKFARNRGLLYIHRSVLSRTAPDIVASGEPASAPATLATSESTELPTLLPTATMTATETATATATETVAAAETAEPTETATETATTAPSSTFTATATEDLNEILVVETVNNVNARVRACASTNCGIVGRLRPGDAIQPLERVAGQTINGSAIWIKFEFQGQIAYIHSSLLSS